MTFPKNKIKYKKGFTLIELLVVIAIIGVLASVVLASLNTARTKGQIAAIKSNLKNMIPQAELTYDTTGNYSALATCAGDPGISNMQTAITNTGGTAFCYSFTGTGDIYTRWGVAAKLNSDNTQNFAVDPMGVVTFDTADLTVSNLPGGTTKSWADANAACAAVGGRLPSAEELKSLYSLYGGNPPNFVVASNYWTSNTYPSLTTSAYYIYMPNGSVFNSNKGNLYYVRCVH